MRIVRILTFIFAIFTLTLNCNLFAKINEDTFIKTLGESSNQEDVINLIRQNEPVAFRVALNAIFEWIYASAQNAYTTDSTSLDFAQSISEIISDERMKNGLTSLLHKYSQYDQRMCKEWVEGYKILYSANSLFQERKFERALKTLTEALYIFRKLDDPINSADALYSIGMIHGQRGDSGEAVRSFQDSLEIMRKYGDLKGEIKALKIIGQIFSGQKKYQEALEFFKQSLPIARQLGDQEAEATSLNRIGLIYYETGAYQESLKYFQQLLLISRQAGVRSSEAASLNRIGMAYFDAGEYEESLKYHKESLNIYRQIDDKIGIVKNLNNIGSIYANQYNYYDALEIYEEALRINEVASDNETKGSIIGNIGLIYKDIGQIDKALVFLKEALVINDSINISEKKFVNLVNIGNIFLKYKDYDKALYYYQQGYDISKKISNLKYESASLYNIGQISARYGNYEEAIKKYNQAYEITKKIGNIKIENIILLEIAYLLTDLGDFSQAETFFKDSIKLSEKLGDFESLLLSYRGLGLLLWKANALEKAVEYYEQAINYSEQIYNQNSAFKEEERSSLIGERGHIYEELIILLLQLNHKHPKKGFDRRAFMVSEKAKSRVFQEMLVKAGARTKFTGDANFLVMVEQEQKLSGQLINLRQHLSKELSKPEASRSGEIIQSTKEQIRKVEQSLQTHVNQIEKKYPRYTDLKRPKLLRVEDLQSILDDDETVLSYSVVKDSLIAFVVDKNNFQLIEIDLGQDTLRSMAKSFREGVSSTGETGFDPEQAYEFYRTIFEPITPLLKGRTRLYISADDVLYTLPFEALVDREVDTKAFLAQRDKWNRGDAAMHSEFGLLHYLIDSYTLAYLPSASVLRSLRTYTKPGYGTWTTPLIAFADPVFSEDESDGVESGFNKRGITRITEISLEQLSQSTGTVKLKRLRQTAAEVMTISDVLGSPKDDIYLRREASEENVYNANLQRAQFVLFSTHGFLGGEFEGMAEPALALSLLGNPEDQDGLLSMSEVLGLDMNTELVALSACNTSGEGERAGQGEGFAGLTRSFMYAGAKSLLVTHWSVESNAARDLMVETFKLMQQEGKPEALRSAKLKMKNSTRTVDGVQLSQSNPYFWSPFVLVGEGG